jgi:DNA-binding transcriptional regulator YiaG
MPNLATVIKKEITRLARREVRKEMATLKRQSSRYRSDIASLKRQLAAAERRIAVLTKRQQKSAAAAPVAKPPKLEGKRFSAKGLKSHRAKLGLSAADYAAIVGCSALSIYHWESGKSRPREAQLARLLEVRDLGVREAAMRLEEL